MENSEQASGNEGIKSTLPKGSIRPNPTRYNRTNSDGRSTRDTNEDDIETTNFDSDNSEVDDNLRQSDDEADDISHAGAGDSTTKQSTDPSLSGAKNFRPKDSGDQSADQKLAQGSNNRGSSGGAGGAQYGRGSNTESSQSTRDSVDEDNGPKVKKAQEENLLGQGGYGSSGTSGTNSDLYQSSQNIQKTVGSPDSSTGSNATNKDVNKDVEINHRP